MFQPNLPKYMVGVSHNDYNAQYWVVFRSFRSNSSIGNFCLSDINLNCFLI